MLKTNKLFDEAIALPIEINTQLIQQLLKSLHPTQEKIDELWRVESEKRAKEIKNKKAKTIDGEEVFKKIR